ncbi:MFS transporter [Nocardia gipuzkoensis]
MSVRESVIGILDRLAAPGFLRRIFRRPGARFAVLSIRNFRLFVTGQVVSVTGTWMMVAAQDWLVLEWTNNSAFALAVITVCQFAPALLVPFGVGSLADRFPKRTLLICVNTGAAALTTAQAMLVLVDRAQVWQLWAFALGLGVLNAVEAPTRMSFVGELVGDSAFRDASALSAMYFSVAQLLGPALAGVLITLAGPGAALAINAASYPATIVGLVMMRPAEIVARRNGGQRLDMSRGLRRISADPNLTRAVVLLAAVGFFALNLRVIAPLLAKAEFGVAPATFGLVTAALAGGSLFAALFVGGRDTPTLHAALGFAAVLGAAEAVLGRATHLGVAIALLVVCGAGMTSFLQSTNHHLQLSSAPDDRTHVIAVYTTIVQGVTPLAALVVAFFAERTGVRTVLSIGGVAAVCVAGAIYAERWRARR